MRKEINELMNKHRERKRDTFPSNGPNVMSGSDLTSWTELEELRSCSRSFQYSSSLSSLNITEETRDVQLFVFECQRWTS